MKVQEGYSGQKKIRYKMKTYSKICVATFKWNNQWIPNGIVELWPNILLSLNFQPFSLLFYFHRCLSHCLPSFSFLLFFSLGLSRRSSLPLRFNDLDKNRDECIIIRFCLGFFSELNNFANKIQHRDVNSIHLCTITTKHVLYLFIFLSMQWLYLRCFQIYHSVFIKLVINLALTRLTMQNCW